MKFTDTATAAAITVGATVGGFLAITTLAGQPSAPPAVEVVEPAAAVDEVEPLELAPTVDLLALTPQAWVPPAAVADDPDITLGTSASDSVEDGDAGSITDPGPSTPAPTPEDDADSRPTPPPAAPQPSPAPSVEEDRVPEYNDRGEEIPFEAPAPLTEPDAPEPDREPDPFAHLDDEDDEDGGDDG